MDYCAGSDDPISASKSSIRGTGKFSGNYAPQPQQRELIWTMPWGCWIELEDKNVHCKERECVIENFTEEKANTTVHRIYGQRATLSVNHNVERLGQCASLHVEREAHAEIGMTISAKLACRRSLSRRERSAARSGWDSRT